MEGLYVWLAGSVLVGLAIFCVRLFFRKIRAGTIRNGAQQSRPRLVRWGSYGLISLIGLALVTPVAFAHEPVEPTSDGILAVACALNDRDPALVAQAVTTNNPSLFKQFAATCYKLPNGPLSKPCELVPSIDKKISDTPELPACFARAPKAKIYVYDPLADDQTGEWTLFSLEGHEIDTIHIYQTKRAELLEIAVPEAGSYNYSLETDSYSNNSRCPAHQKMSGEGEISVHSSSFFIVSGTSCSGDLVWLSDWMLET